ncbi:unnamed protein product [Leptidea sinapis]|uniref:Alcohol dehydrogenase n=1 Tax=Leptidea sinapis TaxID=189913 RepID=A0A5E4PQX0_9NEOP|nr:unnamed protein product [Leptidea sinapis]
MATNINGKTVVVTGGAEGLGLSMVENFLKEGAKLAIILDVNEKLGIKTSSELKQKYGGDRVIFLTCDVTIDLEKIYEEITKVCTTVDILINNAGVLDEKNIRRTMEINAIAVMEWTMKFYDLMRKDFGGNGGTIINVSSIFGYRLIPFSYTYSGSKAAVLSFSRSLGQKYNYENTGVRVITLCPGLTHTELPKSGNVRDDDTYDDMRELIKDYQWQSVDDIGKATVDIFHMAESGTAWVAEGGEPAKDINTIR